MGSIRTYLAPTGKPGAPSRHTPKLLLLLKHKESAQP